MVLSCALVLAGCAVAPTINAVPGDAQSFVASAPATAPAVAGLVAAPNPVTVLAVIGYQHPPATTGVYPAHCVARRLADDELLPDPVCTPGTLGDDVTAATTAITICTRGWTATVRPPGHDTDNVKTTAMAAYGEPPSARRSTELDHLVPLELGGSNDVSNLWPEPSDLQFGTFGNRKDVVENALKAAVCRTAKPIALGDAQRAIATNWTTARHVLGV